jgi:hypothetical protein
MDKFIDISQNIDGQRFYICSSNLNPDQYDITDWSYGFESFMRSVSTSEKAVTITTLEDLQFNDNLKLLTKKEYLFRMWEREPIRGLNSHYFRLKPGQYQSICKESD